MKKKVQNELSPRNNHLFCLHKDLYSPLSKPPADFAICFFITFITDKTFVIVFDHGKKYLIIPLSRARQSVQSKDYDYQFADFLRLTD